MVMADGPQVAAESIGEFITIRDRVVIAFLLMLLDSLDHLRGHIRINIVFG